MNANIQKRPYAAPEWRHTRIRPVAPAEARRRPAITWKARAQAALGDPAAREAGSALAQAPTGCDLSRQIVTLMDRMVRGSGACPERVLS